VLGGGISAEHDVSLVSATEVLKALAVRGYRSLPVWIDPSGSWHLIAEGAGAEGWTAEKLRALGQSVESRPATLGAHALLGRGVGVVFPALHGKGGEDGRMQALLEVAGLRYVGSDSTASALGMSKLLSRLAFLGAELPMAPAFLPSRAEARTLTASALATRVATLGLQYPLFLKEDQSGSTLGVERVAAPGELAVALARVREFGDYWLLEQGIAGVEVTCGVIGNSGGPLRALPPVEIRPRHSSFFDYASKYDSGATEEVCPPRSLGARACRRIQGRALAAHEVLGCRGFSRTDMIVTLPEEEPVLLETNTIPGLTPASLLPKEAKAVGLAFEDLIELMIELALGNDARVTTALAAPAAAAAVAG